MNAAEISSEQSAEQPKVQLTAAEFAALRHPRSSRPVSLTDHAIDWILYLPAEIRPQILSRRYPRIANILAAAWLQPHQFKARLQEYLHDKRGNRQGFPAEVLEELKKLESHFNKLQFSAWDSSRNN